MKFKKYIKEQSRLDIEKAKKELSKKHKVDSKYLDYIGTGAGLMHFNITDPKHEKYKSTITYIFKKEPKKKIDFFKAKLEKKKKKHGYLSTSMFSKAELDRLK